MSISDSQRALVPHTYQGSLIDQRAADGYINATAMCKAASKQWGHYYGNGGTKAFLAELERSIGNPMNPVVQSVVTGPNEHRGTWVHPQVAVNLAQWLSPEFAVKVSQWVVDWMTGLHPTDRLWAQFEDRVALVYDNVPLGYFSVFREISDLFASLITNGADFGTKMILDLSVGLCWGKHWRDNALDEEFGPRMLYPHNYPPYFPQSWSNPQDAWCYPEDAIPAFKRWLRDVYVPQKMPKYLRDQVKARKLPAPIANNALAALAAREQARALPRFSPN